MAQKSKSETSENQVVGPVAHFIRQAPCYWGME